MSIIRSERYAAFFLLAAAALGLILANTAVGPAIMGLQDAHLAIPGTPLDLSVGHWISDGLLAIFFFVAAIELKHELVAGELNTVAKAIRPAIAALGGVIVPSAIYLIVTTGSGYEGGWPIPTATDIAFALGVLAVFGRSLPGRLRIFLLALAILDDIIAIVIIAVFFTESPNLILLAAAVVGVVLFGALSRQLHTRARPFVMAAMLVIGVLTWSVVLLSGVHATIAGVALGLAMALKPAMRTRHALEPVTNGFVLPIFAFSAALVAIPQVGVSELAAPFWATLIALPVGKMIGIGLGGWIASFFGPKGQRPHLTPLSLLAAGSLGGIGFTVSLLMNELAFARQPEIADEGTLAVLLGSTISILLSAIFVSLLARQHRRQKAASAVIHAT
ncbi:Na+/H+ antiporter NhaA [Okibacterium fritillariae]|uniref:Na+/H+ antiporter NhaA n=1 Tax=Okibacterium fritillariae TaxID=123320 RepID=UPI00405582CC